MSLADEATLKRIIGIHWQDEDGKWQRVAGQSLALADLHGWQQSHRRQAAVLIDPELGRLLVIDPAMCAARLLVSASLPAPLPLSGDPVLADRFGLPPAGPDEWIAHVHAAIGPQGAADPADPAPAVHYFADLASALAAFKAQGRSGRIRILDSAAHGLNRAPISDRPAVCLAQPNAPLRLVIEARAGETPVLRGAMRVHGGAAGLELELRGLAIDGVLALSGRVAARCHDCQIHAIGAMRREQRRVAAIRLSHPRHRAAPHLELHHCAVGPITARSGSIAASETVIDGYSDPLEEAIPAALIGPVRLDLVRSTVLGAIVCEQLEARDCVLPYPTEIADGPGSRIANSLVPAIGVIEGAALCLIDLENPQALFASTEFGQPGYAAIARRHAAEIHVAASDGGAIGAGSSRDQARREALLEVAMAEVLPLGVTGRIVWGTRNKSPAQAILPSDKT